MFKLSTRSRLVLCLAMQVISVILLAIPLKLIPDARNATMRGRAQLCEAIAIHGSALIQGHQDHTERLKECLVEVDRRNDDVLSLAVCRTNGRCLAATPTHAENWIEDRNYPIDRQVLVPLYTSGKRHWGDVQVRFTPLTPIGTFASFIHHPWTRLLAFCGGLSFLLFQLFLRRALGQLNPSRAVPKRVRSTLETLAGGLIVLDDKQNIALANQTFSEDVGQTPDELQGASISQFDWAFANENDTSYPWEDVMNHGERISSRSVRLKAADGQIRTYMVNSSPVQQNGDKIRGALVSFDDITDLETARAELVVSKQAAEDANRAKSDFLARMSHEIRTPMNAVLGFADILRRGFANDEDEQRQYLNIIHSSGEHLLVLINDILDLSKIESGKMQVENIVHSPAQILNQVTATLKGRAEEKNISLDIEYLGDVPATIQTDPVRLRQIFTNLIGNSIKFTSKGGVRVQVRFDKNSSKMTTRIVDSGVGIPTDKLQAIFDPFSQADGSVTRKFGGTGLGLAISRKLARALGGDVVASSILGEGSVFTVVVNTGDLTNVKLVTPQYAAADYVQKHEKLQSIRTGLRILVADDGESNRKLLNLVLKRSGATVVEAENGKEAVVAATDTPFDVIFMDMQMPVMDGYQATATLRSQGYTGPIVALTADAMKGTEKRCLSSGCTSYLTKPVVMDDLMETINRLASGPTTNENLTVPTDNEATRTIVLDMPKPKTKTSPPEVSSKRFGGKGPLISRLPTDEDAEFAEIVEMFMDRLTEKIKIMTGAWRDNDLDRVAVEAHWLKGSGGMAGFDEFSEPAKQLEKAAKNMQYDEIEATLRVIVGLRKRIQSPRPEVPA